MEQRIEENSVEEFLSLAEQFDALAAAARTEAGRQGLERLAARFRVFAAQHATKGSVRSAFRGLQRIAP